MFLKLKQATNLLGKDYKLGTHEFPDEVMKDENFKFFYEADLIEVVGAAPKAAPQVQAEGADLAKRLAGEGGFKLGDGGVAVVSEASAVDSAPSLPADASDADDEVESKDQGKKKSKGK